MTRYYDDFMVNKARGALGAADYLTQLAAGLQTSDTSQAEALLKTALNAIAEAEVKIAEQQKTINELRALSTTDELTHLLNRRGFNQAFHQHISSAKRYNEAGVLVILDINHFKYFNDTYGHSAGDKVLGEVASFLKTSLRATDAIARLGGDEFAIVMPKTTLEKAEAKIARVLKTLEARDILWKQHKLHVEMSCGLAMFDGNTSDIVAYIEADRDLYNRKMASKRRNGAKLELVISQ